jgi:hypothetical protein
MGDAARPTLYLIQNQKPIQQGPKPLPGGSTVVLQAQNGELQQNVISVTSHEDASALLSALAMAIVQVLHAQQSL